MTRQAVLLAGGLATRLDDLRERAPKVLQPVAGRPLLDHLLETAVTAGFDRVHLCLGHRAEEVVAHVRRSTVPLTWSVESPALLGTAGALALAEKHLEPDFHVWMGDTYLTGLPDPAEEWPSGPTGTAEAVMYSVPQVAGVKPNVRARADAVVDYSKAGGPEFDRTDAGLYRLRRTVLDRIPRGAASSLETLWRELAQDGVLVHRPLEGTAYDIGTPRRLQVLDGILSSEGVR